MDRSIQFQEWFWGSHLIQPGVYQMALDETLLKWVMADRTIPRLIVRTYSWDQPTLSLGFHQQDKDSAIAYQYYATLQQIALVRRPTGGRAILHGEDVSFAFVTNHPEVLKMRLADSYCLFTTWVRQALECCGIQLQSACIQDAKDYLRSSLCFETFTPSDLVSESGQKVAGSAQLRRHGGILQHGAAFLKPFNITSQAFSQALRQVIQDELQQPPLDICLNEADYPFDTDLKDLITRYEAEAAHTLARLSTTSGSHLVPASD